MQRVFEIKPSCLLNGDLAFLLEERKPIEIFYKEIKIFLGFEDVSAKYFSSVMSHIHWVYCTYILLNSSPPGFTIGVKSMAQKQLMVNKVIENKGLSAVNQL